jgi:hypothetical protein
VANPYENLEAIYHMAEVSRVRAYQQRFQSVRFARYGAQELAAASDSLLFGAIGDTGRIERHVIPLIGTRRVKDLTKTDVNKVLKDIMAGKTGVSVKTKKLRGKAIVRGGAGTATRTVGLLGGILT